MSDPRPEKIPKSIPVELSRKWHALAERRRAHLAELYETGRWKHYYTEAELLERMREAVALAQAWQDIVSPPPVKKDLPATFSPSIAAPEIDVPETETPAAPADEALVAAE